MATLAQAPDVHHRVLDWYAGQARDLPWRRTRDPYAILVAEVMLQQTQVDRVIPKWHAWLRQFPTISQLASATRADAIRAWQGLGYNMRAVRLHAIACQVVADFGGQLPSDLEALQRLNGVGRYTAGAVACFAFEQPVAMVDTNVRRVLGRVFGVLPGQVEAVADQVVPPNAAYPWNQALMDLGATLCRSTNPLCLACPLLGLCGGPNDELTLGRPRTSRASTGQKTSAEAFVGSTRYYRGRLVDAVRSLPGGQTITVDQLVAQVASGQDLERVNALVQRLVADGLLAVQPDGMVALPD
jgi:A/G-specific adenine glycosylase